MAYPQHNSYRPPIVGARDARLDLRSIGFGDVGSRETLATMRRVVYQSLKDPRILEAGAAIVADADPRDQAHQAQILRSWLKSHTKYLNDPPHLELIRTPPYLLDRIARDGIALGDCDDMSVLSAALAMAAGLRARFVAVGFQGVDGPLSHVYTEVLTGDGWVELDVTRPDGFVPPTPDRWIPVEV